MLEQLISAKKGHTEETGDVILLLNQETGVITGLNGEVLSATIAQVGSSIDTVNTINDRPSLNLPAASAYKHWTLGNAINFEAGAKGNCTIEWEVYFDQLIAANAYRAVAYFMNENLTDGYYSFFGNNGYLNQLVLCQNDAVGGPVSNRPSNHWSPEVTKNNYSPGVLLRCATVLDGGQLKFFLNGNLQPVRWQNASNNTAPLTNSYPKAVPLTSIKQIKLGWNNSAFQNTPSHYGNIRVSNFARYKGNYVPEPF